MELLKKIKVIWGKKGLQFERVVFLEGDLNTANLEIEIEDYVEDSHLKLTFYNENEKKLYTLEEYNLQKNVVIKVPNEVLQTHGTVYIRMTQEKGQQVLQATEEIYFYVVKKKNMNS